LIAVKSCFGKYNNLPLALVKSPPVALRYALIYDTIRLTGSSTEMIYLVFLH
jgi:hypothetical protein